MNTKYLLTINNNQQLVDFAPFYTLVLELFQLVSEETIHQEQFNKAFEHALSEMPEISSINEHDSLSSLFDHLVNIIDLYLLNNNITYLYNNPEREEAIRNFIFILFKEQQRSLHEPHYDLANSFAIQNIRTDKLEYSKCYWVFMNFTKWYYWKKLLNREIYLLQVNSIFSHDQYGIMKEPTIPDLFENKQIGDSVEKLLKCVLFKSGIHFTSAFDIKEAIKKRIDKGVADAFEKLNITHTTVKQAPALRKMPIKNRKRK